MLGQLAAPKNLCILHLSEMADICYSVAAVQSIQRQWPHTQITLVCGKAEAGFLEGLNKIEIIAFDKSAGLKGFSDICAYMKGQSFDILLNMQVSFRASLVSYCIAAKTKIGFDGKDSSVDRKWFSQRKGQYHNETHILEGFMEFTRTLGFAVSEPAWNMPLSEGDKQWAYNTLCCVNKKPTAVISLTAGKGEHHWHLAGYIQTTNYLEKLGFSVVICGGSSDVKLAENICQQSEANIINLVAQTSTKQLLALLKQAFITISPDSEVAHMSVTVGTPVVGLYTDSNPRKTGPYLYQKYVVSCYDEVYDELKKQKSTLLPWGRKTQKNNLMHRLKSEDVRNKIDLVIEDFYPLGFEPK